MKTDQHPSPLMYSLVSLGVPGDSKTPEVILSRGGECIRKPLSDIRELCDQVDQDTWGQLCWFHGFYAAGLPVEATRRENPIFCM